MGKISNLFISVSIFGTWIFLHVLNTEGWYRIVGSVLLFIMMLYSWVVLTRFDEDAKEDYEGL